MKVETTLFLVVFIFAMVMCLAYHQEGFAPDENLPSISLESSITQNDTILGLDKTLKKISDFTHNLRNTDREKVTPEEIDSISDRLSKEINGVNSRLSLLISKINQKENSNQSKDVVQSSENLADSADIKSSQILQDAHIQKLKDRLTRLQTNFGKYLQHKNEKNYPAIPVYSSCVISEANGDYSLDPEEIQGKGGLKRNQGDNKVVPSVRAYNPFKEIAKESKKEDSISFEDILAGLSKKNVEINFSIPDETKTT